jgi:ornithine cyclodeaminase/alanine dehydrogenase-like protein (mu-crystallin family)
MTPAVRFLSAQDVRRAFPMKLAVAAMKEAFIQISGGKTVAPPRTSLEIPEYNGDTLVMPVYAPATRLIGLKLATLFGDNPAQGLPLLQALILVMDATTGAPLAVMNGADITAIRTGAASGAATDLLARKDSRVAAIFGAGVQGRSQLEAVCAVRSIRQAYIFDPNPGQAASFAREMGEKLSIPVTVAASTATLGEADIICTATSSAEPVFADKELKSGAHINAIGSYKLHKREVPPETVLRAKVFVDQVESCLEEAGDIIIPLNEGLISQDHILGEIGEILNGDKPGRTSGDQITFFKSVGNAVQDLVSAAKILEAAREMNLGVEVTL